MMDQKQICYHS